MQKFFSTALCGISGNTIEVEVDVIPGMGQFTIVGLGDAAIQESKERVRSAIKNSGFSFPGGARITVNLAPADIKKKGPLYDLPIALGIIGQDTEFYAPFIQDSLVIGELALDGSIRPVHGVLPAAILARETGKKYIFLPYKNAEEACIIPDIKVIPLKNLKEAIHIFTSKNINEFVMPYKKDIATMPLFSGVDFGHIHGQESAKRALTIAAAGGHNILMQGPPGSGKTMLAKALAGILPPLELEEQIEISKIYSVAGLLSKETPLIKYRPFRTIHHTASEVSIIGGGRDARPGEISLAHKGILFLDEFLEFSKHILETLRQPLEDGCITINRIHQSAQYPARFSLIGAMNPCPCGFLGDTEKTCTCSYAQIERYRSRLSGPILDRIDIFIHVPRIKIGELHISSTTSTINSTEIIKLILQARETQQKRFIKTSIHSNSEMSNNDIDRLANITEEAKEIAISSVEKLHLSTRVYYRILRVARTIADIDDSGNVEVRHILEALSYRGL